MKRLSVHMRAGDIVQKLSLAMKELRDMGVEVCVHTCGGEQMDDGVEPVSVGAERMDDGGGLAACIWKDSGAEEIPESAGRGLGLESAPEDLYLTDMPELASCLAAAGRPVIAYVHEGNRGASFAGVRYVLEGTGSPEEECSGAASAGAEAESETEVESGAEVEYEAEVGAGAEANVVAEYFIRVWQRFAGKPWHILDTERCMVRETVEEDLDAFYEIYAQPSVTAYMEGLHPDREQERQLFKAYRAQMYGFYEFGMWTVVLRETGEVIGRAGLDMPMEEAGAGSDGVFCSDAAVGGKGVAGGIEEPAWASAPSLGYVIGVPWQGRGLAEEVCRGILDYAGRELGFDRVTARVHPENVRSIRLLEKLGFECVAAQGKRAAVQWGNPALQRETVAAKREIVGYGKLL